MMVDTATASDRDNFNNNMKCPETERSNKDCSLATERTGAYEDISEEDDEDISGLESASVKRKSVSPCGRLFSNPLSVETAESCLTSCMSLVSGPASAPSAVGWSPSPTPLAFLSPAPSLSPGYLPPYYHQPLAVPSPALSIYQSSTPVRAWQHPFSISSLLGRQTEVDSPCEDSGYLSHHLTDSQVTDSPLCDANEDSYIDVVGLDDDDENNKTKEYLITCEDVQTKEQEQKEDEKEIKETEKANDRLVSPGAETEGEAVCVYDIKKKMLDNWSKSRKDTKERDSVHLSEYQHKKIRKASHEKPNYTESAQPAEPLKAISEEEDQMLKKKSFQLERYEVNTNINKNKRKEEKWSSSEAESPDKYKDQHKVKKKHKSHKEERWKISKNLKSPIRNIPEPTPTPPSSCCTLTETDLVEGLRLLLRVGSHFYAGRLTEISPPDIYGIIIDKERGNKPHIFSRQEIIRDAIVEIRPERVSQLGLGRRICVYWSSQLSYLHPSTVVGPDNDDEYILVQLDDGDSRDVHIEQVRFLPDSYPIVDSALGAALELEFFGGRKGQDYMNDIRKEKLKVRRSKKKDQSSKWSVVVTEVVDEKLERREEEERKIDDDQDSAFESDTEASVKGGKKSSVGITSFLPPQHRLWRWSDEGRKLSAKSRRVYHHSITRGEETVEVGDCAVFLSTGRPDTPYIGRIHAMWQTATGNMRVQVKWFYHPAEVDSAVLGDKMESVHVDHPLFSSGHSDENDVQTISHKCLVLHSPGHGQAGQTDGDGDVYHLVGDYDPMIGTVTFLPGVCQ